MAYMITHFWPGTTEAQYRATLNVVHPGGRLPEGQQYHAAGPTDGGFLVVAVWDSKDASDRFVTQTLMPKLPTISGGMTGQPEERASEIANLVTA